MAWLAVDKNGNETISPDKLKRFPAEERYCNKSNQYKYDTTKANYWSCNQIIQSCYDVEYTINLPKGSIEKLIGKTLTWEDEPVEI